MNVQKALLLITAAAIFIAVDEAAQIQFKNLCPFTIWPSTITAGGNGPHVPSGGVDPNKFAVMEVPDNWTNGRVWGRTRCTSQDLGEVQLFRCLTGDCGTFMEDCTDFEPKRPVTFMEFNLSGPGGVDSYVVSYEYGFNLPVSITPFVKGTGISYTPPIGNCSIVNCAKSLNRLCEGRPRLWVKDERGHVVGCKSPCVAYNTEVDCCIGPSSPREQCIVDDEMILFTHVCPQAHVYPFDVNDTTFTCPTGKDYLITFCPGSR